MRTTTAIIASLIIGLAMVSASSGAPLPSQETTIVIDPLDITIYMNENTTSHLHLAGRANNTGGTTIDRLIIRIDSLDVNNPQAKVNNSSAAISIVPMDRYVNLQIDLENELAPSHGVVFDISLNVNDLQSISGFSSSGDFQFQDFIFYIRPVSTYRNISVTALLPPYATLSQESVVPLFPRDSTNFTDGRSIGFTWESEILFSGQEQAFIIRYQVPTTPEAQSGFILAEIIIVGLIGLAVGTTLTYAGPRIVHKLKQLQSTRVVGVTSEEEALLEIIRQKGNSCPQKDLYTELSFSQAKVSIILNNLEERGLVRRFRDGRENMVYIIEE